MHGGITHGVVDEDATQPFVRSSPFVFPIHHVLSFVPFDIICFAIYVVGWTYNIRVEAFESLLFLLVFCVIVSIELKHHTK